MSAGVKKMTNIRYDRCDFEYCNVFVFSTRFLWDAVLFFPAECGEFATMFIFIWFFVFADSCLGGTIFLLFDRKKKYKTAISPRESLVGCPNCFRRQLLRCLLKTVWRKMEQAKAWGWLLCRKYNSVVADGKKQDWSRASVGECWRTKERCEIHLLDASGFPPHLKIFVNICSM